MSKRFQYQLVKSPRPIVSGPYRGKYEVKVQANFRANHPSNCYGEARPGGSGVTVVGLDHINEWSRLYKCWINGRKWNVVGHYTGCDILVLIVSPVHSPRCLRHRHRPHWCD